MRSWIAVTILFTVVVAACGDDDSSADRSLPAGGDDAAIEATCDAIVDVNRAADIDEDPEAVLAALQVIETNAPPELAAAVAPFADLFEADPEAALASEEVEVADDAADAFTLGSCADTLLEVAATDFSFAEIPSEIDAGRVVFSLTNESSSGEFHEIWLFRTHDDVTDSAEDILGRLDYPLTGMEGLAPMLEFTDMEAIGFAAPGETDVFAAELGAGRYFIACLLPTDSGSFFEALEAGAEPLGGPPHWQAGMMAEFTVG